jgi:DNA-binding transcriptional LysR family regulator
MKRFDLNAVPLFMAVARHRNFRKAANELAVPVSTLSERLRAFEDDVGIRLFNRTTRSVALTEAGKLLLEDVSAHVTGINAALSAVSAPSQVLSGRLRINGPTPALEFRLAPFAMGFVAEHPRVEIELVADERLIDIVDAGYDAGVRYGENLVQDMVAVSLGKPQRMILVASPAYLAAFGVPRVPSDLHDHRCFGHVFPGGNVLPWHFAVDGRQVSFTPHGPIFTSLTKIQIQGALAGQGVAYLFEEECRPWIERGQLQVLLSNLCPPFPAPSLYYPERRLMPVVLRSFVDYILVERESSTGDPAA